MGDDERPIDPAIERFLVTIGEVAFREGGAPEPVWSTGEMAAGLPGARGADLVATERVHRYLVATSGGRDKAVAIAVEEFHRPENSGEPRRDIRTVSIETTPGPIDKHTLLDLFLDG